MKEDHIVCNCFCQENVWSTQINVVLEKQKELDNKVKDLRNQVQVRSFGQYHVILVVFFCCHADYYGIVYMKIAS